MIPQKWATNSFISFPAAQKVKNLLQCKRSWLDPRVGKILWRRAWLPTPASLPGESHGQRSLAGYSPPGHKESDTTERLTLSVFNTPITRSHPGGSKQQSGCRSDPWHRHEPGCRQGLISELGELLTAQWLRVHAVSAGGSGSIPGQGGEIPHGARCSVYMRG